MKHNDRLMALFAKLNTKLQTSFCKSFMDCCKYCARVVVIF